MMGDDDDDIKYICKCQLFDTELACTAMQYYLSTNFFFVFFHFLTIGQQQTTSTITLHLERSNRGMILECVADNIHLPNSAIRDQLILDIHCKYIEWDNPC